jgi:hypothetical protein
MIWRNPIRENGYYHLENCKADVYSSQKGLLISFSFGEFHLGSKGLPRER